MRISDWSSDVCSSDLRAVALMHNTIANPVPLPAIAAEAGIHLRHLERLFHRHLGVSPRGYYQRLRLARARDLVQGTMMGLAQVAEAVGFDSLSHFSKCRQEERLFGKEGLSTCI